MSKEDWDIPSYILDGDNCSDDYLSSYKNRIDMLNGIAKGRAVTTRANRKLQVDALKKALGLNHERDYANNNDSDDQNSSSSNRDSNCNNFDSRDDSDDQNNSSSNRDSNRNDNNNLTRGNSANKKSNCNNSSTKGLLGEKALPDKHFCEGSPDKLMMEALKELNINAIKDFPMAGGPEETKQFEKEKRAPPPQYHLESSRDDVKDRLTVY